MTADPQSCTRRSVTVVICAYTEERWDDLMAAVASVRRQTAPPDEVIVVIDHNRPLLRRVRHAIDGVRSLENAGAQGLSGARNTGLAHARSELVAFLDDDAAAEPGWLAHLTRAFDDPRVLGVGGAALPAWATGRPRWFPREFDWVVGCSYSGLPVSTAVVRNVIGCSMAFRRAQLEAIGGFREGIGRVGAVPAGCEETELCIRAQQRWPEGRFVYEPLARVAHRVPSDRATWRYYARRCAAEGSSKAQVVAEVGARDGLAAERVHTMRTLPRGVARGLGDTVLRRDPAGLCRAAAITAGLGLTTAGYARGRLAQKLAREKAGLNGAFTPTRLVQVDLGEPLRALDRMESPTGRAYDQAQILVRLAGQPVGVVKASLQPGLLTASDVAALIWAELGGEINLRLRHAGLPEVTALPSGGLHLPAPQRQEALTNPTPAVSVVVATHNRTATLARCLDSLLAVDYPRFDVVVVDNAPSSGATADLVREYRGRVRYVREDVPGLAVAHNRGLQEVRSPLVAFTDDDVTVDRGWLSALADAFASAPDVGCVTGMILPAELETPAQAWIEDHGRFGKGFTRRVFVNPHHGSDPLFPYAAGQFGSGANMAFRTSVLRDLGGFDPALGAGSPGVGGDDLAAFAAVLTAGHTLVYEPAAIVHHEHPRTDAKLRSQAFNYGVGLTAYLTSLAVQRPAILLEFARRAPAAIRHLRGLRRLGARPGARYPPALIVLELMGLLYGPVAYLRARRQRAA